MRRLIDWRLLRGSYHGIPDRRRRVSFILGQQTWLGSPRGLLTASVRNDCGAAPLVARILLYADSKRVSVGGSARHRLRRDRHAGAQAPRRGVGRRFSAETV